MLHSKNRRVRLTQFGLPQLHPKVVSSQFTTVLLLNHCDRVQLFIYMQSSMILE